MNERLWNLNSELVGHFGGGYKFNQFPNMSAPYHLNSFVFFYLFIFFETLVEYSRYQDDVPNM